MRLAGLFLVTSSFVASSAMAGEAVLYNDIPEWVDHATIDTSKKGAASPIVFLDQQARIVDGQLQTFIETAFALDTPQALTQFGTLSAAWLPDKGDLTIHRAELLRDGKVIDLLEDGSEFEVLRREQQLESRILNGVLTATLTVSGARLGDIVRLAYSTTLRDQALGDQVQWQSALPAKPAPIQNGRISISWPKGMTVSRVRLGDADVPEPTEQAGFMVWSTSLPVAEPAEKPSDAPHRYLAGELMQVSTYADWQTVSKRLAPRYSVDDAITAGGELADEIAKIARASDDKLTRAALALQLVQDQISYLMNGLDGGNYLPQSPELTWEKRFGDCKAKSVLLLAMLGELGVDAEVVLVRSLGGDALPNLVPMPGNFDHMIVKADIDDKTYWLDGTVLGTRLATIDTVPRFHYALPIRDEGAGLVALDERPQNTPDQIIRVSVDQSAGIRLPALVSVDIEYRGLTGAMWRSVVEQADEDMVEDAIAEAVSNAIGGVTLTDHSASYDVDTGVAHLTAEAIQTTAWSRDRSIYELVVPGQPAKNVAFETDRARAAWRDIPLRLNGPLYQVAEFEFILPEEDGEFEIEGITEANDIIGGVELISKASHEGDRYTLSQKMRSVTNELAASEISSARRELTRFHRMLPVLKSPKEIKHPWDYFGENRSLLKPLLDAYAKAIATADADDPSQLINRARFHAGTYDFDSALKDIEKAMLIEASRELYLFRARVGRQLGGLEQALHDYEQAEELVPDGSTYGAQVELLALLGRSEEGLLLAQDYQGLVNDSVAEDGLMATALGWAGRAYEGQEILAQRLSARPGDGTLLNMYCWHAATWDIVDEAVLASCVDAVEKSDYSAAALDSRALAQFRLGDLDAAWTDINAALQADPDLTASRLLRGIIRVAKGDSAGKEEISLALSMQPSLEATYKAWGLQF